MAALIADVIDGDMSPIVGSVVCNATGKLLKLEELRQKFGTIAGVHGVKQLTLCPDEAEGGAK